MFRQRNPETRAFRQARPSQEAAQPASLPPKQAAAGARGFLNLA